MKQLFMIGLVLLAISQTQCGDDMLAEHRNKRMNDLIVGEWKITQVTYKRASVGKPDSVAHDIGTMRFTLNCIATDTQDYYCTHFAYYKPTNQTTEYESRWSANYNMNGERTFYLNVYPKEADPLQLGYDGNRDITEITKTRLVINFRDMEIVFTK